MKILWFVSLLALNLIATARAASADDPPAPLAGETTLSAAELEKALAELPVFKDQRPLKAHIKTEMADELLGARVEEGELLLDRPSRVLRKFTKPSLKIWMLDGAQLSEYGAATKKLYVKDFSQAPKALKLIQAAFTGDMKTLKERFDVFAFKNTAGAEAAYRFVLNRKAGGESPGLYKRIQAKLGEKSLFFSEIEYQPENGDRVVERYSAITAVEKPSDADFKLELPADVERKSEVIGKGDETK